MVLGISLILLTVAAVLAAHTYIWLVNAKRVTGEIVFLERELQGYRTTIRFVTEAGAQKYIRTSVLHPRLGNVGDRVALMLDSSHGSGD